MPIRVLQSDADLAAALARRDHRVAAEIYRRFAPGMRVFVARIVIDHALAEDVVHDVMVELWEHPHRFQPDRGSLKTWLLTVSHRRAIDRIRSIEAARNRDHRVGLRDHNSVDDSTDQWDVLFDRPALREALGALTPKQREAVTLRYLHDRSHAEVGAALGVGTNTAKTRVRDGLLAMRDLLRARGLEVS